MTIKHLVVLNGGGDTYVGLITPEQWTWIHSDRPRTVDLTWKENDPEGNLPVKVSSGSYENDRAMAAIFGDGEDNERSTFDSVTDALEHAKAQGWQVSRDEYHGYSY